MNKQDLAMLDDQELTMKVMQDAASCGYGVGVIGVAQNARNKKPERVSGEVTYIGKTVFRVGKRRYRPYFDMTQVVVKF